MVDLRLPLYQRLRDDFVARIGSGEWAVDAAVPSENELAERMGAAVGTVRKALDLLVSEGLLVRQQGKGTFPRRASFDASLFRFFRHEDRDGLRVVPDSRILRRAIEPADDFIAQALCLAAGAPTIRLDRLRLIDGVVVLAERIHLPLARFGALAELRFEEFGALLYPLYERVCGQIVTSAREVLTVVAAGAADVAHLPVAEGAPLVSIERTAFDCARQTLEWRRSQGSGEGFRYGIDIR